MEFCPGGFHFKRNVAGTGTSFFMLNLDIMPGGPSALYKVTNIKKKGQYMESEDTEIHKNHESLLVWLRIWVYISKYLCVLVAQLCPTLCNSMDCSSPGSNVHRIIQARILEWFAIPFSRETSQPRDQIQVPALQADSLPSESPGKSFL